MSDDAASDEVIDEVIDPSDRRNVGERRLDRKFELTEAIILAIATIFTAWAAFQATKWSGVQADSYSRASASRTVATRAADVAATQVNIDVGSFNAWLGAVNDEEARGEQPIADDGSYTPDREQLSGFLYERFSDEMLPAFDAWIDTDPFTEVDAPKTPFDMDEYQLSAVTSMQQLDKDADEQSATARDANQRGDNYVMVTVLLASVLFFAGIGSKMDTIRARVLLLTLALVVLAAGIVLVATMPIEI